MITKFKIFEEKNLSDYYLEYISDKAKNDDWDDTPLEITFSSQFRWYLNEFIPKKEKEYMYRVSNGENIIDTIIDILSQEKNIEVNENLSQILIFIVKIRGTELLHTLSLNQSK